LASGVPGTFAVVQLFVSDVPADGDRRVLRSPCGFLTRAWWGDQLIAESSSAVRVDEFDRSPTLYFPIGAVHLDRLQQGATLSCPVKGAAVAWQLDGADIGWQLVDPSADLSWMSGYVGFDHDVVRVELVDMIAGDATRDITFKRFPDWGDAAHLIDMLDVRPVGERRYESIARSTWHRPIVEGSQMLAQSMIACSREVPPGRRVVSAHMMFYRGADARLPLQFELEPLTVGRTFATFVVHVEQLGRRCASGTFMLDVGAPDVVRHGVEPPETPGPYDAVPFDMAVTGRDLRIVDDAYTGDPEAPVGPPIIDAWVRFREVPDEVAMHAALLAQFAGHMPIVAALRPHAGIGQDQAHRTLSTAISSIAISIHADIRADQWMLYRHLATFAGDGMTHSECRAHDQSGRLLASFSVDAMVRDFRPGTGAVDDRTAM
jgi:acyl-CoA thioesterase II